MGGGAVEQVDTQLLDAIVPEQLDPELTRRLPLEFLKRQCAIPIVLEPGHVAVAMADPLNVEAYDAIVAVLGRACTRVICPAAEIEQAITRCYYGAESHGADDIAQEPGQLVGGNTSAVQTSAEDLLNIANQAPVVKLCNKILFQAVHRRASDVHVEPYEHEVRVRFRVDGVLHNVMSIPKEQTAALVSRLKIMANLNIAERRLPQDGQSRIKIGEELVDIRVSVIPTACGERIVLRLLDKGRGELSLEQIGFGPETLRTFRELIALPYGIVLLTGPTGSGKTTTLYAALNELNCEQRNVLTVEDPIEYQLPGVGQMQIRPKINLTFANCLRHILRQDPDVIMIGEIRDRETAEIAIQAALTGHLVLSTLHTNDSASAITRLIDMDIEPYLISSTLAGVMAQRLVRVICSGCKQPYDAVNDLAGLLNAAGQSPPEPRQLYRGRGCPQCLETGYLGRIGIFELLVVTDEIRETITKRHASHVIQQLAVQNGMATLRDDGLSKALQGRTTLEEVLRVTQANAAVDT